MSKRLRELLKFGCVLTAVMIAATAGAAAQTAQGVPNALQGFSQNKDQPVRIDAATLEVRDKDKVATFSGNVQVTQGDTVMKCKTLVVFYDQEATGSANGNMQAAQPGPGGQQQIRRLEAKGGVTVTQKDQTAIGDNGVFDAKSNTVTLNGNVVIKQGPQVMKGQRLVVDLTTGLSHVEGGVSALVQPGSLKDQKKDPSSANSTQNSSKSAHGAPLRLNGGVEDTHLR
jgi:lipopolysaccharide export system protein LptA